MIVSKFFPCIFFLVFSTTNLYSQWQPTNGPEGSTVNDIIKKGGFIFSCTGEYSGGGIYRSSDDGQSWQIVSKGFEPTNKVNSLSNNEDFIFAGTRLTGIFRSSDGGNTWEEKNNGLTGTGEKSTTAVFAHSDSILAGTQTYGIYRSNDNGENWFNFSAGLSGLAKRINDIVYHQGKYFAATDDGVYRYSESLASWESVNGGILTFCDAIVSSDTNLFAETYPGVYRSSNNGESWSVVNNGLPSGNYYALSSYDGVIYTGDDGIVYKSTNAGDNWIAIPNGLPGDINNRIYSLYADSDLLLAGFRILGIYKSSNEGSEWFLSSKGIANVSVYYLESKGNHLYAVTEDADYGLIFRTDNNGEKWDISIEGATIRGYRCAHNSGDYLWAGSFGDGLYRSSDDGNNWEEISMQIFPPSYVIAFAGDDENLFVGSEGFNIDVYKTTDNGNSFENLNVPGSGNITALHSKNGFVFAGRTSGVYKTSDNGSTWVAVNFGFPTNVFVQDINGNSNFIYVSTLNSGLFRSSNNGDVWEEIGSGIINDIVCSIGTNNEQVFAGTKERGVFYSSDGGANWTEFNEGFLVGFTGTYTSVLSIIVKSDTVYCGLLRYGVWKSPVPTITYSAYDKIAPIEFSLSQNYPNPFNPSTLIKFQLPAQSFVFLKVYDVLGNEIATLVNEEKSVGTYEVEFSAVNLTSGIYFYRLSAGTFVETKKMILLH